MAHAQIEHYINTIEGVAVNPDNAFELQCVDVFDHFAETLTGIPWEQSVGGVNGAKDLPNVAPADYWTWTPYNGSNVPPRGSFCIWGGNAKNEWGHVALTTSANSSVINVLQQDGFVRTRPTHTASLGYWNEYTGQLTGWLTLKDSAIKTKETQAMAKTYTHETKWTTKNQVSRSFYGYPDKPTGITIHWWGNDGQKFEDVCHFLSTNNVPTSAHYVVEDGRIATLATPEVATYHSGSTAGNGSTIGIECRPEMSAGDLATLVQLIYELEQTYGSLNLYLHKHWFATACPGRYEAKLNEIVERVNHMHKNKGVDPKLVVAKPTPKPVVTTTTTKPVATKPAPEVLTYKNARVNGDRDVYEIITDIDRKLDRIIKKTGA